MLAEYKECDLSIINSVREVEQALLNAAKEAKASIVASSFHRFEPCGISGVVIISESHLAIHTWPEHSYAAVDIFTCGEDVSPNCAFEYLKSAFKTQNATFKTVERGVLS